MKLVSSENQDSQRNNISLNIQEIEEIIERDHLRQQYEGNNYYQLENVGNENEDYENQILNRNEYIEVNTN